MTTRNELARRAHSLRLAAASRSVFAAPEQGDERDAARNGRRSPAQRYRKQTII